MTAEIGVLNRLGVALAADSAVSIGRDADKIWTSAEKLFQLSNSAPVGVMIYGNAEFVGVPWETIVKEFRKSLGRTKYPTLRRYATRFFQFISTNRYLFPRADQVVRTSGLIESLYLTIRNEAEEFLTKQAENRDGLAEAEIGPLVDRVVREYLAVVRRRPFLAGFDQKVRRETRRQTAASMRAARKSVFGNLPLSKATTRAIGTVAFEMLTRDYLSQARTGVVIAGFGEKEATPSLLVYHVDEMVAGKARCSLPDETRLEKGSGAAIVPFAQQEMVHSFLRGIDPNLYRHISRSTAVLFEGTIEEVLERVGASDEVLRGRLETEIGAGVKVALTKLFTDWEARSKRYWSPVLDIASSLPKDELAAMAEAFVNLTKFRRRITPERETVGGPIDVAVITKGDGFVWVRRKHYFEQSLNPRVLARYERES